MRSENRIQPFLKKVNLEILLTKIWELPMSENHINITISIINELISELKRIWIKNPDLRFSQLLVNNGIIINHEGPWYYMEEDDILKKQEEFINV